MVGFKSSSTKRINKYRDTLGISSGNAILEISSISDPLIETGSTIRKGQWELGKLSDTQTGLDLIISKDLREVKAIKKIIATSKVILVEKVF